ncbi:MAG: U32 family peptidase C-terminal domain-containing protein [Abditibacteriota bacterium]|nr:U32 family peptidase C-terminal domain-containing protein [Abditibacteriota bacterium]
MVKPELLAPAGNKERLKWAAAYGADAVYFGVTKFSLRARAGNFTLEEAAEGISYLHHRGKRGYVTLNVTPYSHEYTELITTAGELEDMGADAFIVADMGVITALRKVGIKVPLHISTQTNTMSAQTVLAYHELGAKRVNLARELTFEQVTDIQNRLKGSGAETEVFAHGALCFSHSGRCAISDYLASRSANRGECAHPCRWKYALVEEKRPGEYIPVEEDGRGLYMFNTRDLAIYRYVPRLAEAGVNSFKIEGRMKTEHYIAAVTRIYRGILDGNPMPEEDIKAELLKIRNHGYTEGFMGGMPNDYCAEKDSVNGTYMLLATVTDETKGGRRVIRVKNSFTPGTEAELLTPEGIKPVTIPPVYDAETGEPLARANNQDSCVTDDVLPPFSIIRKPI